jgi:hypothetical protein
VRAMPFLRVTSIPRVLVPALRPPQDPSTRAWMARNMVEEDDVLLLAWSAFLLAVLVGVVASFALMVVFGPVEGFVGVVAGIVSPLVASSWVSNRPSRMAKREALSYLRHAPAVIGAMAMSMSVSPSLEKAVLFASRSSHDPLGRRLAQASWGVLTRSWPDVESALADLASSLEQGNYALRQSLYLFAASSHEPTKAGMEQLMEKAHEISVQGLKDAAERYVAGLSTPVMVIFALGILLPIMLLSIVPLFALSSPFPNEATAVNPPALPLAPMAFLILVIIPLCCLMYSRSLLSSSPMAEVTGLRLRAGRANAWPWFLWLIALIAYALMVPVETQPYLTLAIISIPPSLMLWRMGVRSPPARTETERERDFILGLYQLGNRLSSGASLEKAMVEAADTQSRNVFGDWCSAVLHRARMARMPLEEAMRTNDPVPDRPLVAEAFQTVARCALGDGAAAGRIAVRLAKSLGQIRDCEDGVKERMRGVMDMMRSTSLIFAPIVLGVTVGLFGLTVSFSEGMDATGWVTLLAGIYVIELAFVVSYLTTFIVENKGASQLAHVFAARMPLAVLAFTLVSISSRAGFALWW